MLQAASLQMLAYKLFVMCSELFQLWLKETWI